jgi:pimeloyl-ACP methyl ester carboxylesterase
MKLFSLAVLLFALLLSSVPVLAVPDSLLVDVQGTSFQSPTGIWWPKAAKAKVKTLCKTAPVVVWFHGGMGSANCAKGLVAGTDFAELYPEKIVVSVSACRENHWVSPAAITAVDAALDSIAARRKAPVERVSLVGVSDGSLGVLVYSLEGRRAVDDRLLMSSFGGFLGGPSELAAPKKMRVGRFRFLQGGKDRLYPSDQTVPWITEFCKAVQVDCELRFDPEGEHDWSYWKGKRMEWIRDAIRK